MEFLFLLLDVAKYKRKEQVQELKLKIQTAYFEAKRHYGRTRVKEELCKTETKVSVSTVAKYMKFMGVKSNLAR